MESRGTITTTKYKGVSAVINYENNQLIFSTKPRWVRIVFGIVGEALASAKERFRINISDVISLKLSKAWTGKFVYQLTLKNNNICRVAFNDEDELTAKLKNDLKEKVVNE